MNNKDSVTLEQKSNSDIQPNDAVSRPTSAKPLVSCRYLILSGEGNIDTEHQFCADFDDLDKCNAFFDRLKAGEFKDTYLYIYEAVKLREA